MTKIDVLQYLIEKGPGRTEAELSLAIFGERATQQMVNGDLALLIGRGNVVRRGSGALQIRTDFSLRCRPGLRLSPNQTNTRCGRRSSSAVLAAMVFEKLDV